MFFVRLSFCCPQVVINVIIFILALLLLFFFFFLQIPPSVGWTGMHCCICHVTDHLSSYICNLKNFLVGPEVNNRGKFCCKKIFHRIQFNSITFAIHTRPQTDRQWERETESSLVGHRNDLWLAETYGCPGEVERKEGNIPGHTEIWESMFSYVWRHFVFLSFPFLSFLFIAAASISCGNFILTFQL